MVLLEFPYNSYGIGIDIIYHQRNVSPCIAAGLLERTDECIQYVPIPDHSENKKQKRQPQCQNVSVLSLYRMGTGDG